MRKKAKAGGFCLFQTGLSKGKNIKHVLIKCSAQQEMRIIGLRVGHSAFQITFQKLL